MKFQQSAVLIGVVGKKGTGQLDNGQQWSTDRVELHALTPFPDSDTMAHGETCMVYAVEDYAAHYDRAKTMIQQEVVLDMEMVPSKKLGQAPKMVCVGFHPAPPPMTKKNPQSVANP
jgi:hypothetical protein